ncbi:hypothetical protein [Prauserella flavalba]|nr:hypothetical protein [Prauserella flavalba]
MSTDDNECRTCGGSGWILETVVDEYTREVDSREVPCACWGVPAISEYAS